LVQEGTCCTDDETTLDAIQVCVRECEVAETVPARQLSDAEHGPTLLATTNLVPEEALTLEVRLAADQEPSRLLTEATAAVVDCLADLYRRVLLTDAKRQLTVTQTLSQTTHLLYRQKSDAERALVLVNEVRAALQVDRVSLLTRDRGKRWRLLAVSGSAVVENGADAGQALSTAAQSIVASKQQRQWIELMSDTPAVDKPLRRLALQGAKAAQLVPIPEQANGKSTSAEHHALLLESFSDTRPAPEFIQQVAGQVHPLLTHCFRQRRLAWQ